MVLTKVNCYRRIKNKNKKQLSRNTKPLLGFGRHQYQNQDIALAPSPVVFIGILTISRMFPTSTLGVWKDIPLYVFQICAAYSDGDEWMIGIERY